MKLKILEFAEEKGIEQGLAQGLAQGVEQGMAQGIVFTIKVHKMHRAGMEAGVIASELGITVEEVDRLVALLKMELAEEKGMEQGMAVAIKVQKMYRAGKDAGTIALELGISVEEVDRLVAMLKAEQLI